MKFGQRFENRILSAALLVALPGAALAVAYLVTGPWARSSLWSLGLLALSLTLWAAFALRRSVVYPLYTLSNLLEALREGDYSLRGARARHGDALGEVFREVNSLAQTLREQRLLAAEASALLAKVVAEVDIAVLTFDGDYRLRLVNPAGARLLARQTSEALGLTAVELGLADCLEEQIERVQRRRFPGAAGRFEIRHLSFREGGRPHHLLVITDLSRALREEERQAWQRLIRVLGHELNNSLTPIKSLSGTLLNLLSREPLPEDWREDLSGGLNVIGDRAAALSRFMATYATLARLPRPRRQPTEVRALLERVARLDASGRVQVEPMPALSLDLDPDQIEQALINLVKNALEASQAAGRDGEAAARIRVGRTGSRIDIDVIDRGAGLAGSDNLFVPFFTTKPGGSGIGLVLALQIVEGLGGLLTLENRSDGPGCVARISLPGAGA